MVFQGCLKGVEEVLRKFQRFQGGSRKFQGCFEDVSRVSQESFKSV